MFTMTRFVALLIVVATALGAQQPNTGSHSMTIDGVDGPPFPVLTSVRTSLPASFSFGTLANQPYALFQGNLHAGQTTFANGIVDLALSPFPVMLLDGFSDPQFHTDSSGSASFAVTVPSAGTPPNGVPLGLQLALQAVVGDPFNPAFGFSLTAATRITVTQGPIITYYSLGNSAEQVVNLSMPIPFYGTSYTTLYICTNGYISFGGGANADATPSPTEMISLVPRIAGQWCDLVCPNNAVKTTFDPAPGNGNPGYLLVEYINVTDYYIPILHTFSILMRGDGYLEVASAATNNGSTYDQIVGISAGNNLGGAIQAQKNFVGTQPPGSPVGPGILSTAPYSYVGGVYESFYEWFGIPTANPYYQNGYPNPYDLPAVTLHFQPTGTGNRYVLY